MRLISVGPVEWSYPFLQTVSHLTPVPKSGSTSQVSTMSRKQKFLQDQVGDNVNTSKNEL